IDLTTKEYALLDYLARHVDQVMGRAEIAEHVWDEAFDPFSNLIEVYIQRLRKKVDEGHALKLLRTLRGEGYMLCSGEPHNDVYPTAHAADALVCGGVQCGPRPV